jgi:hypothetical protein
MAEKIYQQIAAAKKDVNAVGKNRKNQQQNYSFRGIDDAMDAFAPLLAEHGLTIICEKIEHLANQDVVSKAGAAGYRVVNNYTFRVFADDGSSIQGQSDGEAIDYGDKCTTKAQSVALREFLFKTFMVPFHTVEDIEETGHTLSIKKPAPKKETFEKPAWDDDKKSEPKSAPEKSLEDTISDVIAQERAAGTKASALQHKKLSEHWNNPELTAEALKLRTKDVLDSLCKSKGLAEKSEDLTPTGIESLITLVIERNLSYIQPKQ